MLFIGRRTADSLNRQLVVPRRFVPFDHMSGGVDPPVHQTSDLVRAAAVFAKRKAEFPAFGLVGSLASLDNHNIPLRIGIFGSRDEARGEGHAEGRDDGAGKGR